MTKLAITQPTYLPWLGYFQQIKNSDIFVFLDNVQFEKQSWQSRNRIMNSSGDVFWLSVPVQNHSLHAKVNDISIASQNANWQRKHIQSIKTCLGKTPYLDDVLSLVETCYAFKDESLIDLNIRLIKAVCSKMNIETPFYKASELDVEGSREQFLLNVCKFYKATQYNANAGSAGYLEDARTQFELAGVHIKYQDWVHPVYRQHNATFVSHLSWIDAVGHLGFDAVSLLLNQP